MPLADPTPAITNKMTLPAATGSTSRGSGRVLAWLWSGSLIAALTFLVLYPTAMLLVGALTTTNPVVEGYHLSDLSLTSFAGVIANENVYRALANSMLACGGGTVLAVTIGLAFAWIVVRTNTPWKGLIASAGMLPLFVPPLVAGVAWSILGSPMRLMSTCSPPPRCATWTRRWRKPRRSPAPIRCARSGPSRFR